MKSSMKKAGISMVALVITIIVLIVLTSAVVITGVGAPKQAQLAVFKSNIATIQDAVTMKMGNNMITGALEGKDDDYKWLGIVEGYNGTGNIDFTNGEIIVGERVLTLSTELRSIVKISEEELANYYVSEEGTVYHIGFESNGITYYNNNVAGGTYTMTELWQEPSKGTQGVTITISTPQELKDLATYTNEGNNTKGVTFKLMNDITLNENVLNSDGTLNETNSASFEQWIPIGLSAYTHENNQYVAGEHIKFGGVFDGNGYSISGLYVNKGFSVGESLILYNEGIVKNVSIVDSYIHSERSTAAFMVGYNYGTVINCHNSGTIDNINESSQYQSMNIGGIVGINYGKIKGASNSGKILAHNCVAGIVGGSSYGGTIEDSYNIGDILATQGNAAGITGSSRGTIINCYNTGEIHGKYVSGGICGMGYIGTDIISCYNTGSVTTTNNYAGGIVGSGRGKIIQCYNRANVIGGGNDIAGIAGRNDEAIINTYNAGSVNGSGNYIGGIVGEFYNSTLDNVYNLGTIQEKNYSGGLIGRIINNNQDVISNSYNIDVRYFGMTLPTNITTSNVGLINANGTFPDSQPYTNLVTALNAWVNANKTTYPDLKNWVVLEGETYPTFQ